jgi:hypothetical protein
VDFVKTLMQNELFYVQVQLIDDEAVRVTTVKHMTLRFEHKKGQEQAG